MLFTTKSLSTFFKQYKGDINRNTKILEVNTDSRKGIKNSLFIPIVGDNFDGHQFVKQAIAGGAIALLWDKTKELPEDIEEDIVVYFVEDTTKALQQLASYYRDEINPIVIGVTGSNGKTTTKDLVASITRAKYVTHSTKGNFNNQIGLPLTILSMQRDTEVLVLEMGMSGFLEIDLLSKIAKPNYAIITNIGESHIEFLGSREGIAKAKLEILNGLKENGTVIIDGDEALLDSLHGEPNVITCGFNRDNNQLIEKVNIDLTETTFMLEDVNYRIPLLGKHHAKNAAYAIVIGERLGIGVEERKRALLSADLTAMRFELIQGKKGVSIINDAYNASPTSMKAAIEVVKQMAGFKEKVLILGDVLELGTRAEELHQSVAEVIEAPITVLYTFGEHAKVISETVCTKGDIVSKHFHTKAALLDALDMYLNKDSLLLFKASRGLKFESLINEFI
ncbi:UDP-N-acetylmuramoyl-tripeptide--D-alanyl-D-alanine ligase [Oceanobacillus bengalensis]|uniref:UDP-N-acetylmuramoyl-tripeptide--D-alanyl-D-alanine ligase n=1 Tax=Oceanobacillus bengalensis TaxID=1435466 RepID=A0A494Z1I7_9BACI|nr:UDP-N-acetylmuramoyl-tripeptide--D-alanyl-D-alanine ligase [Oceanobacillus bengalensis]RKQ16308.1 UDP-N-acetylmuramoyl-tripeptide--D-alanyl-D-alanine ligase [Oceanobacillus bengalensis]